MSNIFDYMEWRDIDIKKVEFNEIDNLILSRISYFPLDNLIEEEESIKLKDIYNRLLDKDNVERYLQKEDKDFFRILANSKRFGEIKLTNFENNVDEIKEKQFSAVTIVLPDNSIYISYRGTDNTIVGWKEDFNMSFQDLVPSQIEAVNYLENVANRYRTRKIIIGGHSKGGNLAVYAAVFCNEKYKKRIKAVYNNDGPGFQENVIKSKEYKEIVSKVHTYRPQTSIIGKLLNHKEKCITVKSTETGIMQHDLYSWQVLGDKFIRTEPTNVSDVIDKTITNWLKDVEPEQRGQFIDILFDILNKTDAKTLHEMGNNWFNSSKTILMEYKNIDEQSKEIISKTLSSLFSAAKGNIKIRRPKFKKN